MRSTRLPTAALALTIALAAVAATGRAQPVAPPTAVAPPPGDPVAVLRDMLNGEGGPNLQDRQKTIQNLIGNMDLEQLSRALLLPEWRTLETASPTTVAERQRRDADLGQRAVIAQRFDTVAVSSLKDVAGARKGTDALLKTAATADLIGETAAAVRQLDRVNRLSGGAGVPLGPPAGGTPPEAGKITSPAPGGERLTTEPTPVRSLTEQLSALTSDLVTLTKPDTYEAPEAREALMARRAAARALGEIQPDDNPDAAKRLGANTDQVVGALQALLGDPSPELRRVAAESIDHLAQAVSEEMQRSLGIEVDRTNYPIHTRFVTTGLAVWKAVLTRGLAEDQPTDVRRICLRAFGRVDTELLDISVLPNVNLTLSSALGPDVEKSESRFFGGLAAMLAELRNNIQPLAAVVNDPDPDVRQAALTILSDLANARQRLGRLTSGAVPRPEPGGTPPPAPAPKPEALRPAGAALVLVAFADEPPNRDKAQQESLANLNKGIAQLLVSLTRQLREAPDAATRRQSLDVMELLGEDDGFTKLGGAPFPIDALIDALKDRDKYVRWGAARTLGNLAGLPGSDGDGAFSGDRAERAVRGVTTLLAEQDVAVRVAAATALERFGKAAHPPTKDGTVGPPHEPFFHAACQATPWLIASVNHSQTESARQLAPHPYPSPQTEPDLMKGDPTIRIAAMHALEAIEGGDQDCGDRARALGEAVAALTDANAQVRQAAADMVGRLGRNTDADLRQQMIDALGKALTDPVSDVRRAASGALLSLMRSK